MVTVVHSAMQVIWYDDMGEESTSAVFLTNPPRIKWDEGAAVLFVCNDTDPFNIVLDCAFLDTVSASSITHWMDTTGYWNIQLRYTIKLQFAAHNAKLDVDYSIDNGITYHTLIAYSDDGVYADVVHDVSAANNIAIANAVHIRFVLVWSNDNRPPAMVCYIEEVTLLGSTAQTVYPTSPPSKIPSKNPTFQPTMVPTRVPTSIPSSTPTAHPTATLLNPTSNPASIPAPIPTSIATSTSTSTPTCIPTPIPTSMSTSMPTSMPTSNPISTLSPSRSPTHFEKEIAEGPAGEGGAHAAGKRSQNISNINLLLIVIVVIVVLCVLSAVFAGCYFFHLKSKLSAQEKKVLVIIKSQTNQVANIAVNVVSLSSLEMTENGPCFDSSSTCTTTSINPENENATQDQKSVEHMNNRLVSSEYNKNLLIAAANDAMQDNFDDAMAESINRQNKTPGSSH